MIKAGSIGTLGAGLNQAGLLRALASNTKGYKIKAIEVESSAVSVDTEEDLAVVSKLIKKDPFLELYKN